MGVQPHPVQFSIPEDVVVFQEGVAALRHGIGVLEKRRSSRGDSREKMSWNGALPMGVLQQPNGLPTSRLPEIFLAGMGSQRVTQQLDPKVVDAGTKHSQQ